MIHNKRIAAISTTFLGLLRTELRILTYHWISFTNMIRDISVEKNKKPIFFEAFSFLLKPSYGIERAKARNKSQRVSNVCRCHDGTKASKVSVKCDEATKAHTEKEDHDAENRCIKHVHF